MIDIPQITIRTRSSRRVAVAMLMKIPQPKKPVVTNWSQRKCMFVFGIQNFFNDLGSFRAPSLIPLGTYTASVPVAGALIVLFTIEQLINGWRNGFEGPEDADDFAGIVK